MQRLLVDGEAAASPDAMPFSGTRGEGRVEFVPAGEAYYRCSCGLDRSGCGVCGAGWGSKHHSMIQNGEAILGQDGKLLMKTIVYERDDLQSQMQRRLAVGEGEPDQETILTLMKSTLSDKPLSCEDIYSIDAARDELQRVRRLVYHFKETDVTPGGATKVRSTIQDEVRADDYVAKAIPKSPETRQLIHDAIKTNTLFDGSTEDELSAIIDVFEPCAFGSGDTIIRQGDEEDDYYVVESGELAVSVLMGASSIEVNAGNYQEGNAFGELALMCSSPRAATIKATTDCKLWRIKRGWFRCAAAEYHKQRHAEKVALLKQVNIKKKPFKKVLGKDKLEAMAQLLKQEYFWKGDTIIRQGQAGNTVYIIQSGDVDIYRRELCSDPIMTWGAGHFFGENALLKDDTRNATIVAKSPLVVCYVMTRDDFNRVIGILPDMLCGTAVPKSPVGLKEKVTYQLEHINLLNVSGVGAFGGTFGRIVLDSPNETGIFYALEAQGKKFVIDDGGKMRILDELRLMQQVKTPTTLVMHCMMQDSEHLVALLPKRGLMALLEKRGRLPEEWVRFYSASVILAFNEFHSHRVVYRDLRPENIILDSQGHCVLVDFSGSAKKLEDGLTYTFCGAIDYVAPEIVRGKGYNWAVDYWALGVLLFELTSGRAPFRSFDASGTAKKILNCRIDFDNTFGSQIKTLIKALLTNDCTRRLGCMSDGAQGVIRHRFYHGFNWQALQEKLVSPPFKPPPP